MAFEERIRTIIEGEQNLDGVAKQSAGALEGFRGGVVAVSAAVLAANVVLEKLAQVSRIVLDTIGDTRKLADFSTRLGIGVEELDALSFVAERAGITFETFTMGLQRMTRRIAEAAMGTGEAKNAIKELGFEAAALTKLPLEEQFLRLGDAIAKVESPADRVRLAMKLFDSEGVALVQSFKGGREEMERWIERAHKLGTVTTEMAESAVDAAGRHAELERALRGVRIEIVDNLLNAIDQDAVDSLTRFVTAAAPLAGKLIKFEVDLQSDRIELLTRILDLASSAAETADFITSPGAIKDRVSQYVALQRAGVDAATALSGAWAGFGATAEGAGQQTDILTDSIERMLNESLGKLPPATVAATKTLEDYMDTSRRVTVVGERLINTTFELTESQQELRRAIDESAEAFLGFEEGASMLDQLGLAAEGVEERFKNVRNVVRDADLALQEELERTSGDFTDRLAENASYTVDRLSWVFGQSVAHGQDWGDALLSVVQDFVGAAIAELARLAAAMVALGILRIVTGGFSSIFGGSPAVGDFNAPTEVFARAGLAGGPAGVPTSASAVNMHVTVRTLFGTRSEGLAAARAIRGYLQEVGA